MKSIRNKIQNKLNPLRDNIGGKYFFNHNKFKWFWEVGNIRITINRIIFDVVGKIEGKDIIKDKLKEYESRISPSTNKRNEKH